MTAFLNALREEGTKEDCLVQIERFLEEKREAAALIRRLRDERDEARNKALDEAAKAALFAWKRNYDDGDYIAAAILALKEPKP